jgi:hypothetical protein
MRGVSALATTLMATLLLAALAGCGASRASGHTSAGTPTATPAPPTVTPGPPTPTPTALEQRLTALVQPAVGALAYDVTVRFDQANAIASVTATVNQQSTIPATQELVKTVCFRAFAALWSSGQTFKEVSIAVLGLFQGDFGDHTLQVYGSADVTAQTAARLKWASLTPDSAWSAYTDVFLASSYAAGQYWGLPTPTPFGAIDTPSRLAA